MKGTTTLHCPVRSSFREPGGRTKGNRQAYDPWGAFTIATNTGMKIAFISYGFGFGFTEPNMAPRFRLD